MEKNVNTQVTIDRKLFFAAKRYCEEMDKKPEEQRDDLYYALQAWCEKHPQTMPNPQQMSRPKLNDVKVEENDTPTEGEAYELSYTLVQDHSTHQNIFSKANCEAPYEAAKNKYNELLEKVERIELWQLDPYTGLRTLMILSRVIV